MKTYLKHIMISFCISVSAAFFCPDADAQVLAVKTDALMWGALTPNIGFELVTGEHTSFEMSAFGHKNPYGITSKLIAVQPQFRYWFNGRPMVREFVGVTALATTYKSTLPQMVAGKGSKDSPMQVYDGDAIGLGITGGYVLPLGRKFNVEFSCGLGAVCFRQKQYFRQDGPGESQRPDSWGYRLIPVDLGISLCYILK